MSSLYETDVLAWSEEQARALRDLASSDAATLADWDRLAQGVERVGRWAQEYVETAIRTMLAQAAVGFCDPDTLRRRERIERIYSGQRDALGVITPTIRERLDLARLWREAFDLAAAELGGELTLRKSLGLVVDPDATALELPPVPRTCPFTLDELLAEDFTYDRAVEQLYIRLTSWRPQPAKDAA